MLVRTSDGHEAGSAASTVNEPKSQPAAPSSRHASQPPDFVHLMRLPLVARLFVVTLCLHAVAATVH